VAAQRPHSQKKGTNIKSRTVSKLLSIGALLLAVRRRREVGALKGVRRYFLLVS
jgi:hypothetical protein